ncbi:MAG TPA: DUF6220 domain-containing protein [Micromonosporaceae bacterium]
MRRIFVVVSTLLLLSTIVQFYLAAVGALTRPQTDESFALHSLNGMAVIPALSVLATIAAALARAPGRLVGLAILPAGLVVVQSLIIAINDAFADGTGHSTPVGLAIGGLHAIGGLAVMGTSGAVMRRARALAAERRLSAESRLPAEPGLPTEPGLPAEAR